MLRDQQLSILRDISQSVAFADDKHGEVEDLIIEGYVMKDGDLFELTPKGITAVEEHAAALMAGDVDAAETVAIDGPPVSSDR
jgi:hypothetical protein